MAKALAAKDAVSTRMRSIRRVLWIVLVLNLAVAAAKYVYGTVTGSASMQADGIHSVFDSAGNVVGLVGIALASRPADEGHPYGHAKFETYASLVIGVLLLLAAFEVGSSAVAKLASGSYISDCLRAGIKVYFYEPGMLHSKTIVIDDEFFTTGSTNFDFRSMEYNFECNAFIYSKTINEKMKTAFFADLAQSTRITSSTWRRRPFVQKFKESVVRLMSPVL